MTYVRVSVEIDADDVLGEIEDWEIRSECRSRGIPLKEDEEHPLDDSEIEQLKMLVQMNKTDDVFQLIRTYINNRFGTAY